MQWILMVVICGGALLLSLSLHNKKKTELMSKGMIIERGNNFFKQVHLFQTRVGDFAIISGAINRNVLNEQQITFEPYIEHGQIIFDNRISFGSFRARLTMLGQQDGKYHYRFQVESWREGQYGITRQDLFGANVLLTAIERAFLSLDPETTADQMASKYKTKPAFF